MVRQSLELITQVTVRSIYLKRTDREDLSKTKSDTASVTVKFTIKQQQ